MRKYVSNQLKIVNGILPFVLVAIALAGAIVLTEQPQQSSALSGSDFKAGRIIDDEVFYDDSTMTVNQIQTFLNSRVPECDTHGEKWHWSGQTRAEYAAESNDRDDPPYICLKEYTENISGVSTNSGSTLCTGNISSGERTAARIIHDVAKACGINPQVLIVMLQKEMGLLDDDWPWQIQYDRAMGYACPDSGPNHSANCNSDFYGFFNQVYNAAQAFRRYEANPNSYNYKANRNNFIYYHRSTNNGSCSGTSVFIENQATANLYIYTPYQPNKAALDNLYGEGDNCSEYGNRNFWRMFNSWFGPSVRPAVTWQRLDGNSDKTGERAQVGFRLNKKPSSNVTIEFAISSPSNARIVGSSSVTITPNTWNKVRENTITVRGRDNSNLTGTFQYGLVPTKVTSKDSSFNGVGPSQIGNIPLVQQDNNSPPNVYRLYNEDTQQHVLTANKIQRDKKISDGWRDEGIRFSYCYTGNQTVVRLKLGESRRLAIDGSKAYNNAVDGGFNEENVDFAASNQGTIPVYWRYNSSTGNSLYTTNKNEATSGPWEDKGVAFRACEPSLISVYRLYRPTTRSHLFTRSATERDRAINENGFRYEGLGFYSCEGGDVDFYRLFRRSNGNHIYTTSKSEHDSAVKNHGFRSEGVKFRLCSSHERDVYRLYNSATTNHFYTISKTERDHAVKNLGFRDEGIKFQVK